MKKVRCAFLLAQAFFGLTHNDKEIYLEPIFYLIYYLGMTYGEAYNLPIWKRSWYLERVVKEINKANGDSKGSSQESRGLSNRLRPSGPQRTKRFT
jgi:hypothetical protein